MLHLSSPILLDNTRKLSSTQSDIFLSQIDKQRVGEEAVAGAAALTNGPLTAVLLKDHCRPGTA